MSGQNEAEFSDLKQFTSDSDDRTVNNTMRHQYRVLNDQEKAWMQSIKDLGQTLHDKIKEIGHLTTTGGMSRELSIAATKTEEAVMWAVKHITK